MPDAGFQWTHDELGLQLTLMHSRLEDPSAPLEAIGEVMIASTETTVDVGGRPDQYEPLSLATLINRAGGTSKAFKKRSRKKKQFSVNDLTKRAKGKMSAAQPLLPSPSRLIHRSISTQVGDWNVAWGSNLVYAAIQQFGGEAGRGHSVEIPARPYILPPFAEDWAVIEEILVEWAFGEAA